MMSLKAVKTLLEDNAKRTWNPLGVRESSCSEWARGLNLPERGETLLYTGCLYQMVPYIESFSKMLKKLESLGGTIFSVSLKLTIGLRRIGIDLSKILMIGVSKERYHRILRNIATSLRQAGVEFAYLREEPYNGVLYHDLGMDKLFEVQAMRIADKIKASGAKRVITVDPHTTYSLRQLIPEFVDDWNVEVVHYLELLHSKGYRGSPKGGVVAIHDPCYLARWNGILEEPRSLLESMSVEVREPEFTKKFTGCCGGPIESLFPTLASTIAEKRLHELKETGANRVVVMCPICLTNLGREAGKLGMEVLDLAEFLG